MSDTTIHITSTGAAGLPEFHASPNSAPFNTGDTVTFTSADGTANAVLCFSLNALDAMIPDPGVSFSLAPRASVTFQVAGILKGGCCVMVVMPKNGGTPDDANIPQGLLYILTPPQKPTPKDPGQK